METISGKFCPVCKFKNDISVITCAFCGASLENVHKGEMTTRHIDSDTKLFAEQEEVVKKLNFAPPKKGIALYLQHGMLIGVKEEKEFYLGRKTEEDSDELVDLIPFGAFQTGVSRQHAIIRQTKRGYEIVDLESTNGTFIDGAKLVSNKPYPLPPNSQVSLGRLHLLVVYAKVHTKDKTRSS